MVIHFLSRKNHYRNKLEQAVQHVALYLLNIKSPWNIKIMMLNKSLVIKNVLQELWRGDIVWGCINAQIALYIFFWTDGNVLEENAGEIKG